MLTPIQVTREKSGKLTLSWEPTQKKIHIYWSKTPQKNATKNAVASVHHTDHQITIDDPNPHQRTYFILETDEGDRVVAAERRLPLSGVANFRDLGGYQTNDGRRVKWNHFYRSDALSDLTQQDKQFLEELNIRQILDFRTEKERAQKPNQVLLGAEELHLSVFAKFEKPGGGFNLDLSTFLSYRKLMDQLGSPEKLMKKLYCDMTKRNPAFQQLFTSLLAEQTPVVIHCTVGKDRTGFASALLLLALGVSEEQVLDDYLLTNQYSHTIQEKMAHDYSDLLSDPEAVRILQSVFAANEVYLQAALDLIKTRYGTVEMYLEKEYEITPEKRKQLQDRYLI